MAGKLFGNLFIRRLWKNVTMSVLVVSEAPILFVLMTNSLVVHEREKIVSQKLISVLNLKRGLLDLS